DHPGAPGATGADRTIRPAPRPARAAVPPGSRRRPDGPRLRLPEPRRAPRAGPLAPRGGLDGGAALRGERAAVPSRHRLHRMRQRPRVPLRRPGAGPRRGPSLDAIPRAGARAGAARRLREVPAMIRAALLAGSSAALGGAIALIARKRPAVLERTRTFAF